MPVLHPGAPIEKLIEEHRRSVASQPARQPYSESPQELAQPKGQSRSFWSRLLRPAKSKTPAAAIEPVAPPRQQKLSAPLEEVTPAENIVITRTELSPSVMKKSPTTPQQTPSTPILSLDHKSQDFAPEMQTAGDSFPPPPLIDQHGMLEFSLVTPYGTERGMSLREPDALAMPMPPSLLNTSEDADLRELISALEELSPGSPLTTPSDDADSPDDSDELFGTPVSAIDANLDEIIQALDSAVPDGDLDDFELFENRVADLSVSLEEVLGQAKESTELLQTKEFEEPTEVLEESAPVSPDEDIQEDIENADTQWMEQVKDSEEEAADELVGGESDPDSLSLETMVPNESTSAPAVAPSVMEFDDDDQLLEEQLDAMLGENELDIESVTAVKVPAQKPATHSAHSFDFDDMEISIEVDGQDEDTAEVDVPEDSPVGEHDGVLQDLLSTYASLEQNLEEHHITSVAADEQTIQPDNSAQPSVAVVEGFQAATAQDFHVASTVKDARRTLSKLQSLDDALFDEVSALLAKSLGMEREELTGSKLLGAQATGIHLPQGTNTHGTLPDTVNPDQELEKLASELGDELAALEAEGMTVYSESLDHEDTEVDFDKDPDEVSNDLGELSAELTEELSALEAEGLHFHSSDEVLVDEMLEQMPTADGDLADLEASLGEEIAALRAEGLHFHSDQAVEEVLEAPSDPIDASDSGTEEIEIRDEIKLLEIEAASFLESDGNGSDIVGANQLDENDELVALQAAFGDELAALEAEGLTFHSELTAENAEAQHQTSQNIETATVDEAQDEHDFSEVEHEDLQALQSELENQIEELHQEGVTFHSVVPQLEDFVQPEAEIPAGNESLSNLAKVLEQEIAELEEQGLQFHSEENARDELDQGGVTYHSTAPEPENFEQAEEYKISAAEDSLSDLATALEQEIAELEAQGLQFHSVEHVSDETHDYENVVAELTPDSESPVVSEESPNEVQVTMSTPDAAYQEPVEELEDYPREIENLPTEPEGSRASMTGMFLVSDLLRAASEGLQEDKPIALSEEPQFPLGAVHEPAAVTMVTSDPSETPTIETEQFVEPELPIDESISATDCFLDDDGEEVIDLSGIANLFQPSRPSTAPGNGGHCAPKLELESLESLSEPEPHQPLEGAISTGIFLASDFARILEQPEQEQTSGPMAMAVGNTTALSKPVVEDVLWEQVAQEIEDGIDSAEFELGVSELSAMSKSATTSVLFELVEEEILDPSKRRIEVIPTSANVKVENTKLKNALNVFEREEKRVTKLRKMAAELGEDAIIRRQVEKLHIAPAWRRLSAMAVDVLLVAILTLGFGYVSFVPRELFEEAMRMQIPSSDALVSTGIVLLQLAFGLWIVLSTLMVSGRGQTVGGQLFKLEVVTDRAKIPGIQQSLLRALSQVSTLLTLGLGLLPLFSKKKRVLHDIMADTYVRLRDS